MGTLRLQLPLGIALGLLVAAGLQAQTPLVEEAADAQRTQAELQARMDQADDETRELLRELRQVEAEVRRLEAYNAALAPRLEAREAALARRESALDGLADTRAALPALNRGLQSRFEQWVDRDLPFLVEERRARAASLDDVALSPVERLERLLSAWRTELDYGREMDAWRGYLEPEGQRREVDFLRLGRVGLYYLTPDGRQGGVWLAAEQSWQALDDAERVEVRKGLRIARDQRAPELLTLPVSQALERAQDLDKEEHS